MGIAQRFEQRFDLMNGLAFPLSFEAFLLLFIVL
jgi:hypothetical protein